MKYWVLALVLVSFGVFGQGGDSITYKVSLGSTGNFTRSNDQRGYLFNNNAKASRDGKNLFWQASGGWIYSAQSGVKVNNDFTAVLESDVLKKRQRLYYWGMCAYDRSFSLKIDHRLQLGAGVGYTVVDNDKGTLVLSDGFLYERSQLTDPELGFMDYDVWRNSFRVKYRWTPRASLTVDGWAFVQPSLFSWDDTIIKSATTVSYKVNRWLNLTAACTYNRLTLTGRENLIVTYGVTLEHLVFVRR